jgi:hypothetical protein
MFEAINAVIGKEMVSPTVQFELLILPMVATTLKPLPPPAVTVMVPDALLVEPAQPPVKLTVKAKVPVAVGVPLMVTVFADQVPLTPAGKLANVAPVAPVVL